MCAPCSAVSTPASMTCRRPSSACCWGRRPDGSGYPRGAASGHGLAAGRRRRRAAALRGRPAKRPVVAALVSVRLAVRTRLVAGQPGLGGRAQSDGRRLGASCRAVFAGCAATVSLDRATGPAATFCARPVVAVDAYSRARGARGNCAGRFLQAARRLFPLPALLALPLLFAPAQLLPWMRTTADAPDAGFAAGQLWYLNSTFFYARAIVYFAIWLGLARLLRSDRALRPHRPGRRDPSLQAVSAVGFILYAITTTFAAVDWTMSLTPSWHSTEFGLLIGIGQVLSALAGAIVCANALAAHVDEPLRRRFHDLGNLALALVLVWAYLALMQFLIIWIEDLPDEITWFLLRSRTSWSALTSFVVVAHFVLPFLLLLSRGAKRAPAGLADRKSVV